MGNYSCKKINFCEKAGYVIVKDKRIIQIAKKEILKILEEDFYE